MNIDEAIEHAEEQANKPNTSYKCACEHRDLAIWLRKKKELEEERNLIISMSIFIIIGSLFSFYMWFKLF